MEMESGHYTFGKERVTVKTTYNIKNLFSIFAIVLCLMGCAVQETDQAKEPVPEPVTVQEEEAQETDEQIEEAPDKAFAFTDEQAGRVMKQAEKALKTAVERADIYQEEPPEEEEIRAYLSKYFDPSILDYVLYVYQIKTEDGKCYCGYYDYYTNFYMNTDEKMRIIGQREGCCDISVTFQHRWERKWDEEEVTVRIEKQENGRWLVTKMNHWYNDLRFNYMKEMDYEPVYMTEETAKWLIREFGTDENGEKLPIDVETDEEGCILPDSSEHRLTEQEAEKLSRYEQFLAVQEIYARNGKKFDDVILHGYFRERPWYMPYREVFDENSLTETERYNISLLAQVGDLGEMAQAAYGNRYGKEEKAAGQPLSTEEAACIIGEAFDSLDEPFTFKLENKIEEISDDVESYYSLGEYSEEGRLKEYVSEWFSEETFDYLMNMCLMMYGVTRTEDGNYVLMRGLTLPMDQYVLDDFSGVVIKEYTDMECTVTVPFRNLNSRWFNASVGSEGEIVLRREEDRWIIAKISEPNYDEFFREFGRLE